MFRPQSLTLLLIFLPLGPELGCASGSSAKQKNYEEYECPAPVGPIVRENCEKIALKYEGVSADTKLGAQGIGVEASFKQEAIREADQLVSVLKEQRVGLCNDFNTCKLTVSEYRQEKHVLDDSYLALMTVQNQLEKVTADEAVKLLQEIHRIRGGVAGGASAVDESPPSAPIARANGEVAPGAQTEQTEEVLPETAPAPRITPPAEPEPFACTGFTLQVSRRDARMGKSYQYPETRTLLRGLDEFEAVKFYEFALETDTLSGTKTTFLLVADAPNTEVMEALRSKLREMNPHAAQNISCPEIVPARELQLVE